MKTLDVLWGYVWLIQHLKRVKNSDEDFLYVEAIASLTMLYRVIQVKIYSGYLFL